jgi:hypothetical protein
MGPQPICPKCSNAVSMSPQRAFNREVLPDGTVAHVECTTPHRSIAKHRSNRSHREAAKHARLRGDVL